MERISCRIIEDILPLYLDGICSEESRNAVESHIVNCEECRKKLDQMNYSLPQLEVQNNIDESTMIQKLSATWKAKTKMNAKTSVVCIIFYALAIGTLLLIDISYEKGYLRFEANYLFAGMTANFVFYLLFGALLYYLARRPKGSAKTNILEFIVIGIPSIFMATSILTFFLFPFILPSFIIKNVTTISMIGCILLGCELLRFIKNIRLN